jgi:hypothetical protein
MLLPWQNNIGQIVNVACKCDESAAAWVRTNCKHRDRHMVLKIFFNGRYLLEHLAGEFVWAFDPDKVQKFPTSPTSG